MRNAQRVALQDPLSSPFRYGVFKQPPLYVRVVSIVRVIVFYRLDPNFQMRDFYSLLNETEDQKRSRNCLLWRIRKARPMRDVESE